MSFTSLDDFYESIDHLIVELNACGHAQDADRLHGLLHETYWTTGSELLGELARVLQSMDHGFSPSLNQRIADCANFAYNHRKILGLD